MRVPLDPNAESRSELLKKAKRLGGKESKKRKRSSSEDGSSSSSSTESEGEEFGEGLFEARKRALRLTQRCPGCLAAQTVANMKEALLTQSGTLYSQNRRSLPPIFSQYYRLEMQPLCSPSMSQELLTLCQGADLLLRGHPARALDLLAQRTKALDQQIRGGHWTVARQMELVSADSAGLSKAPEGQEAAKPAREELRNRLATQRPCGSGLLEKKEKVRRARETKERERRRLSSKKRKEISNRGEKSDPRKAAKELGEEAALSRQALVGRRVDTLGMDALSNVGEDDIERLLTESAVQGLTMGQGKEDVDMNVGCEELLPRESSVSQCQTAESFLVGGIGEEMGVEHCMEGSADGEKRSQAFACPPSRLNFESCRQVEGGQPEASMGQAFDDCRNNLVKVCRKKGATFGDLGRCGFGGVERARRQVHALQPVHGGLVSPSPAIVSGKIYNNPRLC